MANPTTNYGFVMPTPTDLVTDLPADFEVFGQDVDTQMLANANAAIAKTIVDAKGDLIGATAADTPARLAVGTNGQLLTADSTAATGLAWTTVSASPSFVGASVTKSAAQSISNNTTTVLTWDGEQFDTNTFHDNSTNNSRMTIPSGKAGKYAVNSTIRWVGSSSGRRKIFIYKNGSEALVVESGASIDATSSQIYFVLNLAVSDYVEIYVNQTSGGSLNVYETALGTYFQLDYLGA